jgi:hypothetical protein
MRTDVCWPVLLLVLLLIGMTGAWRRRPHPQSAPVADQLQRLLKPRTPDDCPSCRHADPRPRRGWRARTARAHSDLPLPGVWHHIQRPPCGCLATSTRRSPPGLHGQANTAMRSPPISGTGGQRRAAGAPVASDGRAAVRAGEKAVSPPQDRTGQPCHALWHTRCAPGGAHGAKSERTDQHGVC